MFKIDNANAATSLPTPNPVGPNPGGFFSHGDSSGEELTDIPTQVHRDWLNAVQEEICYVIETADLTLDKNDRTQLYEAINAIAEGAGGGEGILMSVEDDPSPTLGGDLEVDAYKIFSASGNILLEALAGTVDLNSSLVLVNTTLAHRGDTDNNIAFGTDTQTYKANNSTILDISATGLRLGAANARVTSISNDDTMASDSATLLPTQFAVKEYFGASGIITTPEEYYYYLRGQVLSSSGTTYIRVVNPFALSAGEYEIDILPMFWVQTPSTFGAPNFRYNFLSVQGTDDGSLANLINCGNAQSNEGDYVPTTAGSSSWTPFVGSNATTPLIITIQFSSASPTPPGWFSVRLHFRRTA